MNYLDKFNNINICNEKYFNWYKNLINKSIERQNLILESNMLLKSKPTKKILKKHFDYFEIHHIFPKSLCESDFEKTDNNNLVVLTAKEHYIAHLLLWKFTDNKKLALAFEYMNLTTSNLPNRWTNSNLFEKYKIQLQQTYKNNYKKENHPRFGAILSEETKSKISNSLKGFVVSEETKNKISKTLLINSSKPDYVAPNKGRKFSDEYKINMSNICKKVKKTDEWNLKNSIANSNRIHIANLKTKVRKRPKQDDLSKYIFGDKPEWIILAASKPIPDYEDYYSSS